MKIATWNVERLAHKGKLDEIISACERLRADILVLTETDAQVCLPNYKYCIQTPPLAEIGAQYYKPTENRVSVFTNYKCTRLLAAYDKYTAICAELETERGKLLVYGTIIGVYGNRNKEFMQSLPKQAADWERFASGGSALCVCGDYNCSFADNYYFTRESRDIILQSFEQNRISLLTEKRPECIDHIAVSRHFVADKSVKTEEWNCGKTLPDHKGIAVSF